MSGLLSVQKSVAFSGGALLVYDYFLTLSPEIEYIWKAPWTRVKVGFLLNRYINLFGELVVMLEEMGILSHRSQPFCVSFFIYCSVLMMFSGESIRLIVIMRAWSVWGCTYRVTVGLVILYVIYLFVVIAISSYLWKIGYGSAPRPVDGVCLAVVPAYAWLMWLLILVVDSVVLVVAFQGLRKSCDGLRGIRASPLASLLVRDAILFYATSMFNSIFSLICWTMFRKDPRDFLELLFSLPIMSIAGQRLILNLRGLQAPQSWTSRDVSRMVDRELAAMDDDGYWQPESGSSGATGTFELTGRSAQHATLNEASAVEHETCRMASIDIYW